MHADSAQWWWIVIQDIAAGLSASKPTLFERWWIFHLRGLGFLTSPPLSIKCILCMKTCIEQGADHADSIYLQWDACKSPGSPSNRVAVGQVDPPAVRITMVCSLFACCLSASEAFLFLSGAVCWVFSNTYTKEEHLLVFSWLVIGEGPELLDAEGRATPPRHLSKKQKSKSLGLNNVPAWLKIYICVHGELFTGCAVRFAVKISQEYCASERWSVTQRTCEDCERMLPKIEGLARVGEIMIFWRSI